MKRILSVLLVACIAWPLLSSAQQEEASEARLLALWSAHLEKIEDHPGAIKACNGFEVETQRDPLMGICRGIAAWHLMKAANTNEAKKILAKMESEGVGVIGKTEQTMARRWLSRYDIEDVKRTLKRLYLKNIAYPETLDSIRTLPQDQRAPLVDRWGVPWAYSLGGFKELTGMKNQKYRLQGARLGKYSNIGEALALPYGENIKLKPLSTGSGESVLFQQTTEGGKQVSLSPGKNLDGVEFVYYGKTIIILSDGDHWAVFPKPGPPPKEE